MGSAWRARTSNAPSSRAPSRGRSGPGPFVDRAGGRGYDSRMPLIEAPEAAMRLARAICSDVSLYNEEKIVRGIEQDNFFDALKDELEEGRELYRSRVSPELYGRTNFYDRAIIDVILKSKGHVKSRIW